MLILSPCYVDRKVSTDGFHQVNLIIKSYVFQSSPPHFPTKLATMPHCFRSCSFAYFVLPSNWKKSLKAVGSDTSSVSWHRLLKPQCWAVQNYNRLCHKDPTYFPATVNLLIFTTKPFLYGHPKPEPWTRCLLL